MRNGFLIPANSKKSMLMFGVFNNVDLAIFGVGIILSFVLLIKYILYKNYLSYVKNFEN